MITKTIKSLEDDLINKINHSTTSSVELTDKEKNTIIIALQYQNSIDMILDEALGFELDQKI